MTLQRWAPVLVASTLAGSACGSSAGAPDSAVDAFPTAPHTPYPQVPDQGGPRLAHPQLITVTFANDPRATTFEAFAQWVVGSSWLAAVGAEYGVGSGGVAGVAHRPETPPAAVTSADIEAYLAAGVMDGSIPTPSTPGALADALYIIYYPKATSITATFVNGIIKHSCTDFGGYHGEVHQGALHFAYSAIPDCGGSYPGLTADETVELIVSHEVIEATTDAAPITAPAWQLRPDPTDPWATAFEFEVEVGDLCEVTSGFIREAGFVAQRSWSNAAAAAGGEPCVPVEPARPAFGTSVTPVGTQAIAPGAGLDFTLTGWATGTTADWQLTVQLLGTPPPIARRTKIALDTTVINNAGTTLVHVTVPPAAVSGSHSSFFIVSSHPGLADGSAWPVSIDVP